MKVLKWLDDHLEETLMAAMIALIAIVMCIQVIMRYVFKNALTWSDELCRYTFVWMTFFGIGYATKQGSHLKVDVLEQLVPVLKKPLNIFSDFVLFAFCVYMLKPGFEMMVSIKNAHQNSVALNMPMWFLYLSFFLGMILTILHLIAKYVMMFVKKDSPESGKEADK